MIRVAMLSKWHVHAAEYARSVQRSGVAEITCVWDDDVERGTKWAGELGVAFEPSLEKVLARADVDAARPPPARRDRSRRDSSCAR